MGGDTGARLSGDEFVILVGVDREVAQPQAAATTARVLKALARPFTVLGGG